MQANPARTPSTLLFLDVLQPQLWAAAGAQLRNIGPECTMLDYDAAPLQGSAWI